MPRISTLLAITALSSPAWCQTWEREDVGFDTIQSRARDLANKPYEAQAKDSLPEWMGKLSYDQYRDIRFNPNQALWAADKLPFRAMFFHPGYLYREPVVLNEFTSSHQQQIRLAEAYFNYGPLIEKHGDLPPDGGFAGFRLHHPLNDPDVFDELIAFQGASYWRALGKNQRYGLSARGIAVDTGVQGVDEEFPGFREFWLRKPEESDTHARFYALLDGPSYAGAYAFKVHPGNETIVEVRAVIFARREVKRLGIAPMSSMFWFGENSRRRFDDFRPEVHDSDGLAIRMGSGERLWRPICNDSGKLEFSFFNMAKCDGFGLLQRDRRFSAYEDAEAAYHLRPSLWIEPTSDWGPGRVMLMEIPATNELADNTVALWEPDRTPKPGDRIEFSYRQRWTLDPDPSQAGGHVVGTRSGVHDWQPEQRTIVVEFQGTALSQPSDVPLTPVVEALGDAAAKIKIQGLTVQPVPDDRFRVSFQITSATEGGKLAEIGPVELRCCIKRGDNFLTENMGPPRHSLDTLRPLSEEELTEWEEAYAAVEAYLQALRLRNRLLVAELVRGILWRASARRNDEPDKPPRLLAMEEALSEIAEWTQDVLDVPLENRRLAARGRLALLLAGMPDKWQGVFLTPAPWPPDFVDAMRRSYLAAGPRFQSLTMVPKPLEFNAIGSGAAQWWETMDRKPIVRTMFVGVLVLLLLLTAWFIFLG